MDAPWELSDAKMAWRVRRARQRMRETAAALAVVDVSNVSIFLLHSIILSILDFLYNFISFLGD